MKFFRQLPALAFGLVTFSALAGEVAAPSATGPVNSTGPKAQQGSLAYLEAQLRELLTNYGRVDILWYDGLNQLAAAYDGFALNRLARELQPQILINNRNGEREQPEDFDILEQRIGKYQDTRPWESCITICRQWSWKPNDPMKSLAQCLATLVTCAGGDGNLLFNVGPMPDGRIEPRQVDRLREMGAWLAQNGESIYGTRGGPWKPTAAFASTRKGSAVFLHLLREDDGRVELSALARRVRAAKLLAGGAVKFEEAGGKLQLAFDAPAITPIDTVIQLELHGSAMDLPAISPETVPAH